MTETTHTAPRSRIGRSSQREFWISIAALLVANALIAKFGNDSGVTRGATTGLTVAWVFVWARRLHDVGRSAWHVLWPIGAEILIAFFGLFLGGSALIATFANLNNKTEGAMAADAATMTMTTTLVLMLIVQAGFTLWLGLKKGDPGNNRFGPRRSAADAAKHFA